MTGILGSQSFDSLNGMGAYDPQGLDPIDTDTGNISPGNSVQTDLPPVPIGKVLDVTALIVSSTVNFKAELLVDGDSKFIVTETARDHLYVPLPRILRLSEGQVLSIKVTNQNAVGSASIYHTIWAAERSA